MIDRLLWVLQHPTPYNIYLLNGMERELQVKNEVVYRWEVLPSHPWRNLPARHYSHRAVRRPGRRDPLLDWQCGRHEGLVIFVGWRDATVRSALLARLISRRPYAFWADTPKANLHLSRLILNHGWSFFGRRAVTTLATGLPAVERYLAMGIPSNQVDCFPFLVDPDHFAPAVTRRSERSGGDCCRFIICGRLHEEMKGQSVALRALAEARRALPQIRLELVLAGIGEDEPMLRALATELGVGDLVRFIGWVEYDDLPDRLAEADALVIPSRWDPYPVAVIEAMAAGLPVLGSFVCGTVRERVEDGVNGFRHHAGDHRTLARHLCEVASSPALRTELGRRALETSRKWGLERSAAVLREVLCRCS